MAQTPIEWYEKQISNLELQIYKKEISIGEYAVKRFDLFERAKNIEKEAIMSGYNTGCLDSCGFSADKKSCEDYFNETFKK